MKKIVLSFSLSILHVILIAQAPESFSYQAIVRDDGVALSEREVSYQFSIIKGSALTNCVYAEKHIVTTNLFGLVNLAIGNGTDKTGDFTLIDWGADSYFLKVEIDKAGGTSYADMGTTQLLSVPFALYAKTIQNICATNLTSNEILSLNPLNGQLVFNTSINQLMYFNGTAWNIIQKECWPPIDVEVNAGPDQFTNNINLVLNLNASVPDFGTGAWSIISGTGGVFEDINDPQTTFSVTIGVSYLLRWTVTTLCGTSYDEMTITPEPDPAFSHTISIDGINDFSITDEQFSTTSGASYVAYFTWDADYFYIGYKGADINSLNSNKYLSIYLDGTSGTSTGRTINTQTPSLTFNAKYNIIWRTTNDFFQAYEYTGTMWETCTVVGSSDYVLNSDYIELKIPRSSLGSPVKLKVHVCMLSTGDFSEWTYGGVPGSSFIDGYDPDYSKYYEFDFSRSVKPNDYDPL